MKTSDGDLLHMAFVQDKQSKQGVYTGSLGTFTLNVKPNSTLHVTNDGDVDDNYLVALGDYMNK